MRPQEVQINFTFMSSGYMILQSGGISMLVNVSVLSLLAPPATLSLSTGQVVKKRYLESGQPITHQTN